MGSKAKNESHYLKLYFSNRKN